MRPNNTYEMILCYNKDSENGLRLKNAVRDVYPVKKTFVFHFIQDAFQLSHSSASLPYASRDIIILLAEDQQELTRFIPYADYVLDTKLILVLPDRDISNFSVGCTFYPRYITDKDSDFKDIQAVIRKMTDVVPLQ